MTNLDVRGDGATERNCTKCGEIKPLDQFGKKTGGYLGRNGHCYQCRRYGYKTYTPQEAEYRRLMSEARRMIRKAKGKGHPMGKVKPQELLSLVVQRESSEDLIVAPIVHYRDGGLYEASNLHVVHKSWQRGPKYKKSARKGKQRANERAPGCVPEDFDVRTTYAIYKLRDDLNDALGLAVNSVDGFVVDHIVPLSAGGLHVAENLQVIPARSNTRKVVDIDRVAQEYLEDHGEPMPIELAQAYWAALDDLIRKGN